MNVERLAARGLISIAILAGMIGDDAVAQSTVSLVDVQKDLTKFVGRKTCWVGRQVGSSTVRDAQGRIEERTSTWMMLDHKRSVVPEQVFAADESQTKSTDAATKAYNTPGDRGERLVCGTIKGSKEGSVTVDNVTRKVQAPFLANTTLDTIPSQK